MVSFANPKIEGCNSSYTTSFDTLMETPCIMQVVQKAKAKCNNKCLLTNYLPECDDTQFQISSLIIDQVVFHYQLEGVEFDGY